MVHARAPASLRSGLGYHTKAPGWPAGGARGAPAARNMEFVGPLATTSPIIRRAAYSRLLTVLAMVVVGAVCPPFDASLQLPATQSAGGGGGECRAIFFL